ncbi:MAG TPA: glycosyltransferase family 4 protein, partial [Acidimicrobiia bacterium]|nr:glycosyltransferase family 4 protein [Acidimicrobiia bacterium]
ARPLAVPRPDVAARFADAAAPLAGFEHLVTIDGRLGQRVRIDADLVTIDGARRPLSGTTVVIGPSDEPALPRRTSNVVGSLRSNGNGRPQSSTPRLVVFTHDLRLGGAQLYLQELLRDLIKNSNAPCLVVAGQDGPLREELEMLGAAVHVTDFPLPDAKHYEARCVELAMLAQTFGATVALVNTLIAGIGMDAARLLDLPTVWAVHESYTLEDYWAITCGNGRGRALASTSRQALADASLVLFEADATRAAYRREVESDRLTTLYYGIDLEAVAQFIASTDPSEEREHLGLGSDETVLLCIGVFEPRKAQALLAAAFSRLADDHPTARLVMVGETESDYSRHVRQFVKRLGLKDRVRLEPLDANPYRWYRVADAFVVASDLESLPRVVLEAMAFEVPVVATSVWGIPELVREHETGILFPPRDVGALTQALKAMLNMDPLERQRLGRSASRLVHERHDLAAYRRTFNRVVSRLATDPDASPGTLLSA